MASILPITFPYSYIYMKISFCIQILMKKCTDIGSENDLMSNRLKAFT